jgi:hypothetical protein
MSSGAEKLKNNKSIAILDAAERGGYGVVSVVCVRAFPFCTHDISENYEILRLEASQWMRKFRPWKLMVMIHKWTNLEYPNFIWKRIRRINLSLMY